MIDELKSNITNSYLAFVHDFADPSTIDKHELEKKLEMKIGVVLHKQANADIAKKRLGSDFNKAMACYFDRFLTNDGVDAYALNSELVKYAKVYKLHLRKDAYRYLKLISSLGLVLDSKPKGLLAV